MNHLVGLDVECPTQSLSEADAATLAAFRSAHEAARPNNNSYSNDDSHNSDQPNRHRGTAAAQHEVDPATLPACGWRPLDDATLYRFLCADKRHGQFQPERSQVRLRNALSFRKCEGVDAILKRTASRSSSIRDGGGGGGGENRDAQQSSRAVLTANQRSESSVSLTSFASGTLSNCGERVEEVAETVPTNVSNNNKEYGSDADTVATQWEDSTHGNNTSSAMMICPRQLERYQRLRVRVFTGRDHQGQPVMFERLGHFLGSGNCDHFAEEEWIRFYIWDLERHFTEMRRASMECGRGITRFTFVADAEGIVAGIMNRAVTRVIPLLKALIKSVEEHYPEIADRIVLFNVPRVASVFYRAVRAFLDPVTADKIQLHSGVPLAYFDSIMDRSAVPREYGGTNDVPYPPPVTEA